MSLNQRRWHLLRLALEGRMTLREATERMDVSYRHTKRLKGVVARGGPVGLLHGNTGRRPAYAIGVDMKHKIVELSRGQYAPFNDTHFTQKLSAEHEMRISRETVRKIRRETGILPKQRYLREAGVHWNGVPRRCISK